MTDLIAPDTSSYQVANNRNFNRRVHIFRVTQGTYFLDPKFLANSAQAAAQYKTGKTVGAILYHVFTKEDPVAQYKAIWKAIGPTVPPWLLGILVDIESWRGTSYALSGNHSPAVNKLLGLNAAKMGSWNSSVWYGNQGDLAELAPQRDARTWGIVAAYTSSLVYKKVRGARGQQYTDGQVKYPVPTLNGVKLPRASIPFGACDHNVFPGMSAVALRAFMRPATVPPKPTPKPDTPGGHPVPPAPAPKPKPHLYPAASDRLVSADRKYALFLRNDGKMDLRHMGTHVAWVETK